jgi:hypothetical protein
MAADFALWQEFENVWGICNAQPVRMDFNRPTLERLASMVRGREQHTPDSTQFTINGLRRNWDKSAS